MMHTLERELAEHTIRRLSERNDALVARVAELEAALLNIAADARHHAGNYTPGSHGRNAVETFGAMARAALKVTP